MCERGGGRKQTPQRDVLLQVETDSLWRASSFH